MTDEHRSKIANSQILNRLIAHALGQVEMTATQVQAAQALLRKVLPDLSQVEMQAETTVKHEVLPTLPTQEEWERDHTSVH